jgi:hypothetical protein
MQSEASPTPEQALEARLDEGLRAIQDTANQLMHEVASEIWRAAGGDKDQTGSRILESISRDQGMRSLIAHADERFQSLAVRTARLEDTMSALVESIRQAKDELSRGVDILHEVRADDAGAGADGFGDVRTQLDQVSEQIAVAFRTLTERDRAIVETVQAQIRGHGELITQEAGRIAEAMEAYVQAGVAAMGQLAGSVEAQMSAMGSLGTQDELGEQLQLMYERMAIDATSVNETLSHLLDRNDGQIRDLSEQVQLVHERVTIDTRELATALQTRVLGLARLMRSDSQRLHTAMTSDAQELRAGITELRGAIAELGSTVGEGAAQALDAKIVAMARLVRSDNEKLAEQIASDQEASKQALRAMKELQASLPVEVIDSVERRMETLAESVQKANEMLAQRIDRMAEKIGERQDSDIQVVIDRMGDAMHALAGLGRGGDASGSGGGVGTA